MFNVLIIVKNGVTKKRLTNILVRPRPNAYSCHNSFVSVKLLFSLLYFIILGIENRNETSRQQIMLDMIISKNFSFF